ncbi:branched-chain amino acid ABC transporter permease [Bradyrhizobium ottawaense]|uniref:branched-chain amino acid ABC transporter permease n=1 Tax=Bradyrhizobium ottawaense TaxID=931866 RepID=UPI00383572FE
MDIFGLPSQAVAGQLLLGLINGSFYALLSLGLAVIFGMLNITNFAHGAQYMMGAFCALLLLKGFDIPLLRFQDGWVPVLTLVHVELGFGYWWALVVAPILVGLIGVSIERLFLRWLYKLDQVYGLLLTFGLALIIQGAFRNLYGTSGRPYRAPLQLQGSQDLGFMILPNYRAWVLVVSIVVCASTWFVIERTRLGSYLRAATENPTLVRAFGVNVPLMITLTYGFGVALAALAGVMAAPIYNVSPLMGADLIIVVFAVVVIGGMGSMAGAIFAGYGLGLLEAITKMIVPQASETVIFIVMMVVLLIRPQGLLGRA